MLSSQPLHILGTRHDDIRGFLWFNNLASLAEFQRVYIIENSAYAPMRGWHGHKLESKGFICLLGSVRIGGVKVEDWDTPSTSAETFSADLTQDSMDFVYLPAGYANAILSLTPKSRVMVFSSSTLEESQDDDYRFPTSTWRLDA